MGNKEFLALLDDLTLDEKIRLEDVDLKDLYKLYPNNIRDYEIYLKRSKHKRIYFGDKEYPNRFYNSINPPYFIDYIGEFPKKNTITLISDENSNRKLKSEACKFTLESNLNDYYFLIGSRHGICKEVIYTSIKNGKPVFDISPMGIFNIEKRINDISRFQLMNGGGIITISNPFTFKLSDNEYRRKNFFLSSFNENLIAFSTKKNSFQYKILTEALELGANIFSHKEGLSTDGTKSLVKEGSCVVSSSTELIERIGDNVKGHLYYDAKGEYSSDFGSFSFLCL